MQHNDDVCLRLRGAGTNELHRVDRRVISITARLLLRHHLSGTISLCTVLSGSVLDGLRGDCVVHIEHALREDSYPVDQRADAHRDCR